VTVGSGDEIGRGIEIGIGKSFTELILFFEIIKNKFFTLLLNIR